MMRLSIRGFAGFVLMASAAVLGTALLSQYWGGLAPCELCLMQRWPWDAAIVVSLVALFVGNRPALPWVAIVLAAVFAIGAGLAFYHVGVEQKWFAGPSACTAGGVGARGIGGAGVGGAGVGGAMTLEEMKRQILGTAPVLCDKVQWALFGISLAGLNLIASLGMAAVCLATFVGARRPAARAAATA